MPAIDPAQIRSLLVATLGDEASAERLAFDAPLLGSVPELDSIAIVNLLLALEERFGIEIEDDEVTPSIFATLAALHAFVTDKLGGDAAGT